MRNVLCTLCLLVLLSVCAIGSVCAQDNVRIYAGRNNVSFDAMSDALAKADVVVVGEQHDHKLGHQLELRILQEVAKRAKKTALSLEFFERDVQSVLDEYLAGFITETHFLQSSRPWPTYKTDYAPMIEFAKTQKIPVIAANAPRRYVNMVSRKGTDFLTQLPTDSKRHLGPLPYDMDLPEGYQKMLDDLFGPNHAAATPGMPAAANLKQSQALWDVTMADSVLRARNKFGATVIQMNGAGHSDHGWGLVDRLRRREPNWKLLIVTIKPDAAFPALPEDQLNAADFVIVTPKDAAAK